MNSLLFLKIINMLANLMFYQTHISYFVLFAL